MKVVLVIMAIGFVLWFALTGDVALSILAALMLGGLIALPLAVALRLKQFGEKLHDGYQEGRTEGMTDAQKEAYLNQPPVAYRHHGKICAFRPS